MAARIRLARHGAKKKPFYRVVVAHGEAPRDGRFIEIVGTYDPFKQKPRVTFKTDRLNHWLKIGAQPTLIVKNLIKESQVKAA